METWFYILLLLGLLAATIAVLPARYDPAMRLVEWLRSKGNE
jgi:hypothetical protein